MLDSVILGAICGLLAGEWLVILWLGLELTGVADAIRSAMRWRVAPRRQERAWSLSPQDAERIGCGMQVFRAAGMTTEEAAQALGRFGAALRG